MKNSLGYSDDITLIEKVLLILLGVWLVILFLK